MNLFLSEERLEKRAYLKSPDFTGHPGLRWRPAYSSMEMDRNPLPFYLLFRVPVLSNVILSEACPELVEGSKGYRRV